MITMLQLEYFLRLCTTQHITQTAKELYISQTALSSRIIGLEKELGVKLFHRTNNHIRLTDVGELVVARAKELDGLYQHMLTDISRLSSAEGQRPVDCHIYTTQLISSTLLFRVLSTLNLRYPGIHLNIEELDPPEIADGVTFTPNTEGIISMSTFHEADSLRLSSGTLVFDHYFQDELMLGVAENSPLAERKLISAEELATIPLALCNNEAMMIHNLLEPGAEPSVALHVSSYDLCREMISRNRAAGLTSQLRNYYSKCPMKAVPLEKNVTISYGCIYDPATPKTPFLTDLFNIVSAELNHVR